MNLLTSKNQSVKNQSVAGNVAQRKPNNTGLPDNLKSGIENLSGHSMDDVKGHYNSSRPAQLQAHAFAQGNQIHLASGQEKHLPHEAWHVVQQKLGRVKPTMQLKSNSDHAPIQRKLVPSSDGIEQTGLKNLCIKINSIVEGSYYKVKNDPLKISGGKHIDRWKTEFSRVSDSYHQSKNLNFALKQNPFFYAAFGYAVESLSNPQINKLKSNNYSVFTQVSKGSTTPDVVIRDDHGEVAWLDITAENSVGHIFNKVGAGWKNRAYVAEVTYPSLKNTDIIQMITSNNYLKAAGYGAAIGASLGLALGQMLSTYGVSKGYQEAEAAGGDESWFGWRGSIRRHIPIATTMLGATLGSVGGLGYEFYRQHALANEYGKSQGERKEKLRKLSGYVAQSIDTVRQLPPTHKRPRFREELGKFVGSSINENTARSLIALYAEYLEESPTHLFTQAGFVSGHNTGRDLHAAETILNKIDRPKTE
ncbi:MAG: DUF4157 domain-containing protein [Cyclobacteriaceae bacterium]